MAVRFADELKAVQLASQAEIISSLRAENEVLRTSQTKQDANPGPVEPAAATSRVWEGADLI